MTDEKDWYRSKTIWGGLVAIAAALAGVMGLEIDAASQGELVDALAGAAAAAGGLIAIIGRLSANSTIR